MSDRRCPLSYEPLSPGEEYSTAGLKRLSPRLAHLERLPFTSEALLQEAAARTEKMSIGGVQPKVSAVLRVAAGQLELVDTGGRYILKPPNPMFPELPENEDVTMRMAAAAGVSVPIHGLVYTAQGDLTYLIERFDRVGSEEKLAVEDFAQLSGLSRETKYASTMERVATIIDTFCTFPAVEKVELFRRVLVAYLTGNEDMHIKNFSLLTGRDGLRKLSPAYDMVNSTIALKHPKEEMALPLMGKQSNLQRTHFIDYYGRERLNLTEGVIDQVLQEIETAQETWDDLLARSFLSAEMKEQYAQLLASRRLVLGL